MGRAVSSTHMPGTHGGHSVHSVDQGRPLTEPTWDCPGLGCGRASGAPAEEGWGQEALLSQWVPEAHPAPQEAPGPMLGGCEVMGSDTSWPPFRLCFRVRALRDRGMEVGVCVPACLSVCAHQCVLGVWAEHVLEARRPCASTVPLSPKPRQVSANAHQHLIWKPG